MSTHAEWADSVGAYVIGALPPGELEGFRAHLDECAECRRVVAELELPAAALPMGTQQLAPPPDLKRRIMAVVEAEAELLAAAGAGADRPPAPAARPRERRLRWAWPGFALAAVLLLLAGGALAGGLLSGDDGRTVVAETQSPRADVRLEIDGNAATLVVRDMPEPPGDRIYQVWLKRPGRDPEPTDALWSVNADGAARVAVPGSLEGVEAVLVTDEPQGGSSAPSKPPVIVAPLA
jgi:anti-sigma-K factor RskA